MLVEIQILLMAVGLGFFQLFLSSALMTRQRGIEWNAGPRDGEPKPLTGFAARSDRAFQNFKETFPFLLAVVLAVAVTGRSGNLSQIGAGLYLGCRIFYIPLYLFGVPNLRSVIWVGSLVGIILIGYQACGN